MPTSSEDLTKNIEHYSYSLAEQIGRGFSSTVYRGKNNQTGSEVAIKVINLHKLSQKMMHELLESEIAIIKTLHHPNLLNCENVYVTINNCYIITELCKGGDLASQIKKKGRLRGMEALKLMLEISKGFSYLCDKDIIHRDLKPANILLHNGTVKIGDFGFARLEKGEGRKEKYNIGTPLYMSPEALNSNFYSRKTDIWSLGVMFYQILQGRTPWEPKNEKELKQMINEKKDIIFRIAIRDELETLIKGCLKYDPSHRISIESIIATLQQIMGEMLKEDISSVYRETLTRRLPHALSCRDLNKVIPMQKSISNQDNNFVKCSEMDKENLETRASKEIVLNRNKTEISLNAIASVEEASRKNHFLLKAGINLTRFIYKTFPKVQKLQSEEYLKLTIQAEMVAVLDFMINWLERSIRFKPDSIQAGLQLHQKFVETRCYKKTLAVIEEYQQRYRSFTDKMKAFMASRQYIPTLSNKTQLLNSSKSIKTSLKDIIILQREGENHNIGVDYLVSLVVLLDLLGGGSLENFARTSFIEEIVEAKPAPLGTAEIEELKSKKSQACWL